MYVCMYVCTNIFHTSLFKRVLVNILYTRQVLANMPPNTNVKPMTMRYALI